MLVVQSVYCAELRLNAQKATCATAVIQDPVVEALDVIPDVGTDSGRIARRAEIAGEGNTGRAGTLAAAALARRERNVSSCRDVTAVLFLTCCQRDLKPACVRNVVCRAKVNGMGVSAGFSITYSETKLLSSMW